MLSFVLALALFAAGCQPTTNKQSVSGTIEVDEAHVASRYGGRVEKVLAAEGETLKIGQVIVEIEAAELRARRDQAAAQLADLEAGSRKEEIEEPLHAAEALAADLDQARADAKRADELFAQKTIAGAEHDQAVNRARSLEQSLAAARSRYELAKAGSRPERITLARAQLAEIDAQLREMKIAAPSDCVLEVLSVKVGDVLAPNREVATVLLPQHIWVRVYVPEPWLGHIRLGAAVKARVDAEPGKDFAGVVEQIARVAEFTPRNVQTVGERIKQVFGIKIRFENTEGKLRAGMATDVSFPDVPK